MSVAPEIARLAETVLLVPAQPAVPAAAPYDLADHAAAQLTLGTLARRLRSIAATPERWWGLVRFEPGRSVQIMVEECAAYRARTQDRAARAPDIQSASMPAPTGR